ncbi:NAD-dependent epimerase/dehydratase family protein [Actinokineospora xionganensis]|uniref:NAD-dependent epimerase/dehydratase family protein n=1 Tax=Actinokineospora xionganensis TaxID=2684470 RepID=A0ABR7LDB9_9PSEU|nr:NAD-dependent epimerase/dehydratase family protein [Actinokineospora xionganensis]MBC6450552.1 NAD-dependent epimerase/dehydratase family protein [Actinokineospora xionganensis]
MLVTVTGGTGFVGSHSVAALLRTGHQVRLLVRDESTVDGALRPLGLDPGRVDVVVGDVLDESSVIAAVRGADAVLHAAAVYSFDSRQRDRMRQTTERGTQVVLGAARRSDVGRVVHVSTVAALFGKGVRVIGPDSPVGTLREPYLATKAAAERIARAHQDAGTPVAISYPPALLGPHDPRLGDQSTRVRDVLRGLTPIWPTGGFPLGDVRDTAALHAEMLTGSLSGGRHFGPGTYVSTKDYLRHLRAVTGRALPAVRLPARALGPVGHACDLLQRVWPWHLPVQYGAIHTCACATRVDDQVRTHPITARPVADTIADTVRWLHAAGHLTDRQAGRRAHPSANRETTAAAA